MKKDAVEQAVLEDAHYGHWDSTFGMGPCGFGQGAIDKACGRCGDVYVYYRHEHLGETTYAVYPAAGVEAPLKHVEAIERGVQAATYDSLAEAKKGPYKAAFTALRAYLREQSAKRKARA